jgi:hypothetical protein
MEVGGYNKEPDWVKIGPSLLVAASLVLAIRTSKWGANECSTASSVEWDAEVERSIKVAHRVLSSLLAKSSYLFAQKNVPRYQPSDEDVMK